MLSGLSLDSFTVSAVATALAAALGVSADAVDATVQDFQVHTTVMLAGSVSTLTSAQLTAVAASFAASLSLAPSQVQAVLQPAQQRRQLLKTSAVHVDLAIVGLGSDAAAVAQPVALLTAPATLNALVASLGLPGITGATATPAVVSARLAIVVRVPAATSATAVAASLSGLTSGATLIAALQAAGVTVAAVSAVPSPPPPPPPKPAPPPPVVAAPAPAAVQVDNVLAVSISLGVFGALLAFGGAVYCMRRIRYRKRETMNWRRDRSQMLNKVFGDGYDEDGKGATLLRHPTIKIFDDDQEPAVVAPRRTTAALDLAASPPRRLALTTHTLVTEHPARPTRLETVSRPEIVETVARKPSRRGTAGAKSPTGRRPSSAPDSRPLLGELHDQAAVRPATTSALSLAVPSSRFATLGEMMARVEAVERRLSELDSMGDPYSPRANVSVVTPRPFESRVDMAGDGAVAQQLYAPNDAMLAALLQPAHRSAITPPSFSTGGALPAFPGADAVPHDATDPFATAGSPRPERPARQLSDKALEALASRRSTPLVLTQTLDPDLSWSRRVPHPSGDGMPDSPV